MASRNKRPSASWSVVEAKSRLDDVIEEAEDAGPQTLVRNNDEQAVIVPPEDWQDEPITNLLDFFRSSGLGDYDLDITRHPDRGRDIEL